MHMCLLTTVARLQVYIGCVDIAGCGYVAYFFMLQHCAVQPPCPEVGEYAFGNTRCIPYWHSAGTDFVRSTRRQRMQGKYHQ